MKQSNSLETIRQEVSRHIAGGVSSEEIRAQYLGRKGKLTLILRELAELPLEERKQFGQAANELKEEIEIQLNQLDNLTSPETVLPDTTVPPFEISNGTIHPISAITEEMVAIFKDLSFEVVEGHELVTDKENFETLNITKDHPARDSHDSFYVAENLLLRTQTTAMQVLEMNKRSKKGELPIRIVVPGKTYRRESDQTHSAMFHQIDAVMVDTQTTFSDLKGVLEYFVKRLFGDNVETRFRPHFFPFTEPSAEIDIRWKGKSATEGKHTGWLEMLGCGMIHPEVLARAGINPRIYQGWAFGMGIERPIMIRKQIPDLRLFFHNSSHFLNQFTDTV